MKKKVYVDVKEEVIDSMRTPVEIFWNNRRYKIVDVIIGDLVESSDGSLAIPCKCLINGKYHTVWMDGNRWFVEIEKK